MINAYRFYLWRITNSDLGSTLCYIKFTRSRRARSARQFGHFENGHERSPEFSRVRLTLPRREWPNCQAFTRCHSFKLSLKKKKKEKKYFPIFNPINTHKYAARACDHYGACGVIQHCAYVHIFVSARQYPRFAIEISLLFSIVTREKQTFYSYTVQCDHTHFARLTTPLARPWSSHYGFQSVLPSQNPISTTHTFPVEYLWYSLFMKSKSTCTCADACASVTHARRYPPRASKKTFVPTEKSAQTPFILML